MKIGVLFGLLVIVASGCLINKSGTIRYNDQFNTVNRVNKPLDEVGIIHSLSDWYGRGLMKIRDKKSKGIMKDQLFSIVSFYHFNQDSVIIMIENPTSEGDFYIRTTIEGSAYQSIVEIDDWPARTVFTTLKSCLLLSNPVNDKGMICGRIKYRGRDNASGRVFSIKSIFYYNQKSIFYYNQQ